MVRASEHGGLQPAIRDRAPRSENLPIALTLLSFVALACCLAFQLNIWIDESYSLATTSGDLATTFTRALTFENQAPLYFVVLRLWRYLDQSAFFARLLSVLAALGLLFVLARLGGGRGDRVSVVMPLAYAATCPVVVWAAVEIRLYALALLLALLLLVSFERLQTQGCKGRAAAGWHAAVVVLSLYTYYFLGFLLLGNLAALVAAGSWKQALRYALVLAGCLVLVVPVAYWTIAELEQVERAVTSEKMTLPFAGAARLVGEQAEESAVSVYEVWRSLGLQTSGPTARALYWGTRVLFVGAFLLSLGSLGAAKSFVTDRRVQLATFGLVALWLQLSGTVSMSQAVAATVRNDSQALTRHSSLLIVPVLVLLVLINRHAQRRSLFNGAVGLLVVLNVVVLGQDYSQLAKQGDSKRVAAFLERVEAEGEPVLVFPAEEALPLRYYYEGSNRIVPIPREPSLVDYQPQEYVVRGRREVETAIAENAPGAEAFWLVHNEAFTRCCGKIDVGSGFVKEYFEREFVVARRETFAKGVAVSKLQRQ